ncbi:uncharacterized protein LOC121986582 [Zingiber officinale]|uniref:uncharacterized protein LOC121986582 n=1 Tax=Zingiber officinale TaxID=94328 RepID=UPI001C4C9A1A|nr:uncharacterized protein LOC121986582 [Zingiber officinale]
MSNFVGGSSRQRKGKELLVVSNEENARFKGLWTEKPYKYWGFGNDIDWLLDRIGWTNAGYLFSCSCASSPLHSGLTSLPLCTASERHATTHLSASQNNAFLPSLNSALPSPLSNGAALTRLLPFPCSSPSLSATTKEAQSKMKPMLTKSNVGNIQKPVKFLAPGKLAKERGYRHRTRHVGDSTGNASAYKSIGGNASAYKSIGGIRRLQVEEQKAQYIGNQGRIGGISAHTLIVHFEEDEWKERDFTEDSSFLDILNICKKFIDIYSVGFKVTDADGKLLRNDKDLLAMLKEHEDVENIEIYLDVDETAQPLHFKMPQDNPSFDSIPRVPKVRDVTILGYFKTNEKVKVRGDVVNGTEQASTVQWFITVSKNFDIETGLQAISKCTINKDFQIPIEAVGHYLVVKFTPMTEDGESGESRFAITDKYVDGKYISNLENYEFSIDFKLNS